MKTTLVIYFALSALFTMLLGIAGGMGVWIIDQPFLHAFMVSVLALSSIWSFVVVAYIDD